MGCSLPRKAETRFPRASAGQASADEAESYRASCLPVLTYLTMAKHCTIHPETELVVVEYCPVCRGQHGGTIAAKGMSAEERSRRARKAARARWPKTKKRARKR
jgi:hypothetical protein